MDVVFYETQMMNRAFMALRNASVDVQKNAFLESFILHLRNLIYFFKQPSSSVKKRRRKNASNDLTYADFQDKTGHTLSVVSHAITEKELGAINKHLQHMTKARLQQKVFWPSDALLQEMNRAVDTFLHYVADSYFPTREGRTRDDFQSELIASVAHTKTVSLSVTDLTSSVSVSYVGPCPGKVAENRRSRGGLDSN